VLPPTAKADWSVLSSAAPGHSPEIPQAVIGVPDMPPPTDE
jgi:hypothetical protein